MAAKHDFTVDQFRKKIDRLEKMDSDLLSHIPCLGLPQQDGRTLKESLLRLRGMIDAMTEEERRDPDGIDFGHCQRIAAASDTEPNEVEKFLVQFKHMRKMMRTMSEMSVWRRIKLVLGFERVKCDENE